MTARILVVDDIEANVRLLEAKLTAEYYEVVTAADGVQALAAAAEHDPDIILLDVMMPGMDGFEVCRRLKADPATRHIPVVLVTALDGRRDRLSGLEAGADDFLTKPIDDVILFARVRSLGQAVDEGGECHLRVAVPGVSKRRCRHARDLRELVQRRTAVRGCRLDLVEDTHDGPTRGFGLHAEGLEAVGDAVAEGVQLAGRQDGAVGGDERLPLGVEGGDGPEAGGRRSGGIGI